MSESKDTRRPPPVMPLWMTCTASLFLSMLGLWVSSLIPGQPLWPAVLFGFSLLGGVQLHHHLFLRSSIKRAERLEKLAIAAAKAALAETKRRKLIVATIEQSIEEVKTKKQEAEHLLSLLNVDYTVNALRGDLIKIQGHLDKWPLVVEAIMASATEQFESERLTLSNDVSEVLRNMEGILSTTDGVKAVQHRARSEAARLKADDAKAAEAEAEAALLDEKTRLQEASIEARVEQEGSCRDQKVLFIQEGLAASRKPPGFFETSVWQENWTLLDPVFAAEAALRRAAKP